MLNYNHLLTRKEHGQQPTCEIQIWALTRPRAILTILVSFSAIPQKISILLELCGELDFLFINVV